LAARPEHRAKLVAGARALFADPVRSEKRRAAARRNAVIAQQKSDRVKGGRTRTAKRLGWCPLEYRRQYCRLRRDYGAAEARRMIEELVARDLARYVATGQLQQSVRGNG
jgi:hypothetical protein